MIPHAEYQPNQSVSNPNLAYNLGPGSKEPEKHPIQLTCGSLMTRLCWLASLIVLSVISAFLCFHWGEYVQYTRQVQLSWFSPPGHIETVFRYQKSFTLRPDNESTFLWASMFPGGNGFIKHPEVSPEPTCLAVYHQLHCLDAIRSGYWAAIDGIEPSHHARPAHVRHCIDYIRQSLICHADTNLEPINYNLGGVTGFDSEKRCRDYDRVTAWANEWRARDGQGT